MVGKTSLANEQVDNEGCSGRFGAKVDRQLLRLWFLKITDYSETGFFPKTLHQSL